MQTLKDKLVEWFENQGDWELSNLNNQYVEAVGNDDDTIYQYETFFDEMCCGQKISEIIYRLDSDDFSSRHDYVKYSGYGNIVSTSDVKEWVDIDEIVDYIIEDDDDLGEVEIRNILNEDNDEFFEKRFPESPQD